MNTRKPTKKEVPDGVKCWVGYSNSMGSYWWLMTGRLARVRYEAGDFWLPYDALPIPDPTQPTTKGRKA